MSRFIVIEGTDGSGKTTQLNMLADYLTSKGKEYIIVDFPQYDKFWGELLGRFLSGEFGELEDVSPYLIQPIYMLDQASQAERIKSALLENKYVLANRYITSSMAHQTAKFDTEEKRNMFLDWMIKAGYGKLGLIREDIVIFLYVSLKHSSKMAKTDEAIKRKNYLLKDREIAEDNMNHQIASLSMYEKLITKYQHWKQVDCCDKEDNLLSKEVIHKRVLDQLKI